jgi:hypothetical protein
VHLASVLTLNSTVVRSLQTYVYTSMCIQVSLLRSLLPFPLPSCSDSLEALFPCAVAPFSFLCSVFSAAQICLGLCAASTSYALGKFPGVFLELENPVVMLFKEHVSLLSCTRSTRPGWVQRGMIPHFQSH